MTYTYLGPASAYGAYYAVVTNGHGQVLVQLKNARGELVCLAFMPAQADALAATLQQHGRRARLETV